MKDFTTDWTPDELKAYLLLYCTHCHIEETDEDKELIISKVDKDIYKRIHKEIDKDNDYQSLEKILNTIQRLGYTHDDIEVLIQDIKELFLQDGEFDTLEQNMLRQLKHLLN
ncbi:MAG: hypothetical protein KDC84_08325 [Crocinitomicaceae bacterium]|nr:hypothetical protein [Crocinitomicaceae bacterium]